METYPSELKYSKEHEWVLALEGAVRVGVTHYATGALGDIVYVSLPVVGTEVVAGDTCGELESTKSVSDVYCPVNGVIIKVNDAVVDAPELINDDPYGDGWLFEIELAQDSDLSELLDSDGYAELVEELD